MAENLGLPQGFEYEEQQSALPAGFSYEETPQEPDFLDRIGGDFLGRVGEGLSKRGEEIGKIATGGYPEQTRGSDVWQTVTNVAGAAVDTGWEALKSYASASTPDWIEEPVKKAFGAGGEATGEAISDTAIGRYGMEALKRGGEWWTEFEGEHPEAARNMLGTVDILEAAPFVGPAFRGAKVLGKGAVEGAKTTKDVLSSIRAKEPITYDVIRTAERDAYNTARRQAAKAGTKLRTQGIKARAKFNIENTFGKPEVGRIDVDVHPKSVQAIQKISDRFSAKSVDPIEIEDTRRLINDYINSSKQVGMDTPDTVKLYHIKDAFDDAVDGIKDKDFIKGDKQFLESFKEARKISTVRHKVEPLQDIFNKASLPAKGSSYEVSLKNGFRSLANNKRKMKKYTKEEQFLIKKAASTGSVEGITNKFAVFSPTSGKLGAALSSGLATGAVTVNPALAAFPIVGMGAKAISDKMARGSAERAFAGIAEQLNPPKTLTQRAMELYKTKEVK